MAKKSKGKSKNANKKKSNNAKSSSAKKKTAAKKASAPSSANSKHTSKNTSNKKAPSRSEAQGPVTGPPGDVPEIDSSEILAGMDVSGLGVMDAPAKQDLAATASRPVAAAVPAAASVSSAPVTKQDGGPIFNVLDKLAFWIAFLVSLAGYTLTLAPSVTLEDAGELAVASDYLGVPHPPGYPIWSLLSWFFQWVFNFMQYNGNPNPAWSVAWMSAFFAALAVGLIAMVISRSGRHIVEALQTSQGSIFDKPLYPAIGFFWMFLIFAAGSVAGILGLMVLGLGIALLGLWFVADVLFDLPLPKLMHGPALRHMGGILFGAGLGAALCLAFITHRDTNLGIVLAIAAIALVLLLDQLFGLLQSKRNGRIIDESTGGILAFFAGVGGALLWAFTPVMWSQAVIVEVYSLNAFFMALIFVLTYMWMSRPEKTWLLYATSFAFGIGITNHHALIFSGPFLIAAIGFRNRKLFVHALMLVLVIGALFFFHKSFGFRADSLNPQLAAAKAAEYAGASRSNMLYALLLLLVPLVFFIIHYFKDMDDNNPGPSISALLSIPTVLCTFIGGLCVVYAIGYSKLSMWPMILLTLVGLAICCAPLIFQYLRPREYHPWPLLYGMFALTLLGLGFHGYMAFASEQNPPMNWAYARTPNGFLHSVGRKQYEKISISENLNKTLSQFREKGTRAAKRRHLEAGKDASSPFTLSDWRSVRESRSEELEVKKESLIEAQDIFTGLLATGTTNELAAASNQVKAAEVAVAGATRAYDAADTKFDQLHKSKFFLFYQLAYFFFSPNEAQVFSMVRAFTPWISLLVIFTLVVGYKLNFHMRTWIFTALIGFFSFTVLFLLFQYPNLTNQDLFIKRVQYIQAHGLWAVFVSYGLIILGTLVIGLLRFVGLPKQTGWLVAAAAGIACSVYFPWKQIDIDQNDAKHIRDVGSSAMNGHDFGWQFGFYQLRGANGVILDELADQEKAGTPIQYCLDQGALDYIQWSKGTPENVQALQALVSDTVMDASTFNGKIMKALEDREWRQKRLVREACSIAAYKRQDKPVALNDLARTYLARNGVDAGTLDLSVKTVSALTADATAKGFAGPQLDTVVQAGRFGARYASDRDAILNLDTLKSVDPAVFQGNDLKALQAIATERVKSEDEVRELIAKTATNINDVGVNAILTEARLMAVETVPELDPSYPPEMEQDAIFYGGTDPGRFVPTYMIYSAKVREDVKLITQNALADHTYMNVMRDLYGKQIWMPSTLDSNKAFQQYYLESSTGQVRDNAQTDREGGRMQVQGVLGVMQINSHLCKYQHENCKRDHAFYVEESYPIQWMYPYMKPHGLILQIHPEPIEITKEDIDKDMNFWKWYCRKLERDPAFKYDVIAQKTFSKLRGAIAGLYEAAGDAAQQNLDNAKRDFYYRYAELAYLESVRLFPQSPEANQKYGRLLIKMRKFDEVGDVMQAAIDLDPENKNLMRMKTQADALKKQLSTLVTYDNQINQYLQQGRPVPRQFYESMLLYYSQFGEVEKFDTAVKALSDSASRARPSKQANGSSLQPADKQLRVVEACRTAMPIRMEQYKIATDAMLRSFPNDYRSHFAKAVYLLRTLNMNTKERNEKLRECFRLIQQGLKIGGNPALQELIREQNRKFAYLSGDASTMRQWQTVLNNARRGNVPGQRPQPGGGFNLNFPR